MPIRFRCAYCNQLMGIARRKAGTVVSCPSCAGQVIVPSPPEKRGGPRNDANNPVNRGGLFEVGDIDAELFQPAHASAPPRAVTGGNVPGPATPQNYDVVPLNTPPGAIAYGEPLDTEPGLFLTRNKVILIGIAIFVLLGLMFLLGILVGSS